MTGVQTCALPIYCGWKGDWTETNERTVDDIELDICPECGGDVEEVEQAGDDK